MELVADECGGGRFAPVPVGKWRQVMELLGLPDTVMAVTIRNPRREDMWENYATLGRGQWIMIVEEHVTPGPQLLRSYVPVDISEPYYGSDE